MKSGLTDSKNGPMKGIFHDGPTIEPLFHMYLTVAAVMMSVRRSFHTLKPVKTEERRPLVSNCWMTCATFASAVGETKLALTAMLKN